jgi:hypothetical protein
MGLKGVLIIGPDIEVGEDKLPLLRKMYLKENYLVIGDGKKNVTVNDLMLLAGKIDPGTRIDITAHGTLNADKEHCLQLNGVHKTSNILTIIGNIGGNLPVNVHLWSCFGGSAYKDVVYLPTGSVLVTHGPLDATTIPSLELFALENMITKRQKKLSYVPPSKEFIDNIPSEAIQSEIFSTHIDNKEYHFFIQPKLSEVISDTEKYLDQVSIDFNRFYSEIHSKVISLDIHENIYFREPTLTIQSISEYQKENFLLGYFIYKCGVGELNGILEENIFSENQEIIASIINKKINLATPLFNAIGKNNKIVVAMLLKYNADPNLSALNGYTPLHKAVNEGYKDVVDLLLSYNANPNSITDKGGFTPLGFAAKLDNGEIVESLLNYNANPNLVDKQGFTPMAAAAAKGNAIVLCSFLKYKVDPNIQDYAITPLIAAIGMGHKHIVMTLIKCGTELPKESGQMAIKLANYQNYIEIAAFLQTIMSSEIKYTPEDCPCTVNNIVHTTGNTGQHDEL